MATPKSQATPAESYPWGWTEYTSEELEQWLVAILKGAGRPTEQDLIADAVEKILAWRQRVELEHSMIAMLGRGELIPVLDRGGALSFTVPNNVAAVQSATISSADGPTDAEWELASRAWRSNELSVREIARRLRVSPPTVYNEARRRGWGQRNEIKRALNVAKNVAPYEEKTPVTTLSGRVRCPSCHEWTETDPCSQCYKTVRDPL